MTKDMSRGRYIAGRMMADEMGGMKLAKGGKTHSDAKQDRKMLKSMVKPSALKKMAVGGAAKVRHLAATPSGAPKAPKVKGRGKVGRGGAC